MSGAYFDFKRFRVFHDRCAMKVGTDSVVLGVTVKVPEACTRILDIGTGCGLLALMLAQRFSGPVDAIEIEEEAATQAAENFLRSPWKDQLHLIKGSIQDYALTARHRYSLIISNPPYFEHHRNYKVDGNARKLARQTTQLSFAELVDAVAKLLTPDGEYWHILPTEVATEFRTVAESAGMHLRHRTNIRSRENLAVIRCVEAYSLLPGAVEEHALVLYDADGKRSADYSERSRDYYL